MDVQAIEQILAKPPGSHFGLEVPIGSGEHSRLDCYRAITAQAGDFSFFEHPEELGLCRKRKLADFVEKQSASRRRLERSLPGTGSAGKRAPFVPEQLALHQIFGKCRTVDCNEWGAGLRPPPVQVPGNQLLAGPALAQDQHRTGDPGQALNGFAELPDRRAVSHERRPSP
jgi:hypothetical protein